MGTQWKELTLLLQLAIHVRPSSCITCPQDFLVTSWSKTPGDARRPKRLQPRRRSTLSELPKPHHARGRGRGRALARYSSAPSSPVPTHLSFLRSPRAAGLTAILGNVAAEVWDGLQEDRPSTFRGDCGGVLHSEWDSEPAERGG